MATLAGLALMASAACESSGPGGTSGTAPGARPASAAVSAASAAPVPSASASGQSDEDEKAAPWVRGLSKGCKKDDDCIKVRACSSYAIRRDVKDTFKKRIQNIRFRCEREPDADQLPETRAACVAGTCKLVTK